LYRPNEQAIWWFAPPPSNFSSSPSSWYVTLPVTNNTARMMTVYPAVPPPPEVNAAAKEVEFKEQKSDHKYAELPLDRAADEGDFFANNIPWPRPPPSKKTPPKYWRGPRPPHPNKINQEAVKQGDRRPGPPPPPKRFYSDDGLYQNVDPEFYSPPASVSVEVEEDDGNVESLPLYYYPQSEPVLEADEEAFPVQQLLTNELDELPLATPQSSLLSSGASQTLASHSGGSGGNSVDRVVYRPRVILCVWYCVGKNCPFMFHLHPIYSSLCLSDPQYIHTRLNYRSFLCF
jgi:hypothetical protein